MLFPSHLHASLPAMVYFMCQVGWATWYPNIWSNVILNVPVSVFLDEINIWISKLRVTDCHPQGGWASSNQLKVWTEPKTREEETPPAWLIELGHWAFFTAFKPKLKYQLLLGLQPAGFWIGTHTWTSGLQTPMRTLPSAFLCLQLANCRCWDLSASIIV